MSFSEFILGEVCDVGSSKRIYAKEYCESGIPFYRSKEVIQKARNESITDELYISEEKYIELDQKFGSPQYGDILLASIGANLGISYFVNSNDKFYFKDGNVTWFRNFNKEVYSKFLYYWLNSRDGQNKLLNSAIGSAQKALTIDGLKKLKFQAPLFEEQKAIAKTLSCLDDKIELNNRINKTLEEMAQAIFKSWFVDFEPFKNGEFEDSELGKIPKGWSVKVLGEFVDIVNGYSYKGSELKESDDAMMTIKNFDRNGGFKIDGFKEIEISERVKDRHYYINIFDVLVACTDLTQNAEIIGNPILVLTKSKYNNLIASMDLVKIVPKVSFINKFFLYTLMRNEKLKKFLLGYTSGTTVLHLNKKSILEYKIALPSEEHFLKDFSSIIEPLFKLMSKNINENGTLTIARDALLPKLMSGEIRVPIDEVQ